MKLVEEASATEGVAATCEALDVCRATYYRHCGPDVYWGAHRPPPPRSLLPVERRAVLDVRHEDRFADLAPAQVYATLSSTTSYWATRLITTKNPPRRKAS